MQQAADERTGLQALPLLLEPYGEVLDGPGEGEVVEHVRLGHSRVEGPSQQLDQVGVERSSVEDCGKVRKQPVCE